MEATRLLLIVGCMLACITMVASQDSGFKPGVCPTDLPIDFGNCTKECLGDADCEGAELCCFDDCSSFCIESIDAMPAGVQIKYTAVACEHKKLGMSCRDGYRIKVWSAFWGRGDSDVCPGPTNENTTTINDVRCSGDDAYRRLVAQCNNKQTCSISASVGFFGEPCFEEYTTKYFKAEFLCEAETFYTEVCENSGIVPLKCPDDKLIVAQSAFWGRHESDDNRTCPHPNTELNETCSMNTALEIFHNLCDGRNYCQINARWELFGEPCYGIHKYLETSHTCAACVNDYGDDAQCDLWALQGECNNNPEYILPNCRKSCWNCDPTPPKCENKHHNETACELWADDGDCYTETNSAWMQIYCRKTCSRCDAPTDCSVNKWDRDMGRSDCDTWYNEGQCVKNMEYMFWDCSKSCFGCETDSVIQCKNKYYQPDQCDIWALNNQCHQNPGFMLANCLKSCTGCTEDPQCVNVRGDDDCNYWQSIGECTSNPVFMYRNCWKSCMRCAPPPVCTNIYSVDSVCDFWRRKGACATNPGFMLEQCWGSCFRCNGGGYVNDCLNTYWPGEDGNDECNGWAYEDQCNKNPNWMFPNCRESCTLCNQGAYNIYRLGVDAIPAPVNKDTRSSTFIMSSVVTVNSRLTHFFAYFAESHPVFLEIWRPSSSRTAGDFELVHHELVRPRAAGFSQTVKVKPCVLLLAGDRIGFTTHGNDPSPIGAKFDLFGMYQTTEFRPTASSNPLFSGLRYPYKWSFGVGYELTTIC